MKQIQDNVEMLLEEYPATRNDDGLLYYMMCKRANPAVTGMSFGMVIQNMGTLGIPNYESVRRARQKLQEHKPELRASARTTDERFKRYKEMRAYAQSEI